MELQGVDEFKTLAQSLWQLRQKYKDDANTIKANCDNWVFLTSRDLDLQKIKILWIGKILELFICKILWE
jgi:hypothetical protein